VELVDLQASGWVATLYPWEFDLAQRIGIARAEQNLTKKNRHSYDAERLMADNELANVHSVAAEIGWSCGPKLGWLVASAPSARQQTALEPKPVFACSVVATLGRCGKLARNTKTQTEFSFQQADSRQFRYSYLTGKAIDETLFGDDCP